MPRPSYEPLTYYTEYKMKIYNGDCLEILPEIPDASVDMILADLPYGCTACKWDVIIPFEPLWAEYKRIIKPKRAIVLFGNLRFGIQLINSAPRLFRYEWIWQKMRANNFLDANKRPLINHEFAFVFGEKQPVYHPQKTEGKPYEHKRPGKTNVYHITERVPSSSSGGRYPLTIQKIDKCNYGGDIKHNTEKPVQLLEYLIKTYTQPGDVVLDNVMGSGSTGVACANTDRDFIGIEKDPDIFEIAKERLEM